MRDPCGGAIWKLMFTNTSNIQDGSPMLLSKTAESPEGYSGTCKSLNVVGGIFPLSEEKYKTPIADNIAAPLAKSAGTSAINADHNAYSTGPHDVVVFCDASSKRAATPRDTAWLDVEPNELPVHFNWSV